MRGLFGSLFLVALTIATMVAAIEVKGDGITEAAISTFLLITTLEVINRLVLSRMLKRMMKS